MSVHIDTAETDVRALTRHTGDTTRLTQPAVRRYLNLAYRQIRTWLQLTAPELYLLTSLDLPVAAGGTVNISEDVGDIDGIFRVDQRLDDGTYRPLEVASYANPNVHGAGMPTFREEGGILRFGPDATFSGTVRVLYYAALPDVTDDDDPEDETFQIPASCDMAFLFLTCGLVALQDGDGAAGKASWDGLADKICPGVLRADKQLRARRGVHQERAGLQRIQGY
ncbi:MAG TPA: hypothetical protein VJ140_19615 [Actinomycetota bacterium]|nr:hypothetical protein [Actinomycetota bacterium]